MNEVAPVLDFALRARRGDFQLRAQGRMGGGVTGICGPSGCGKSTLLALIAGLLRPSEGTLLASGQLLVDTAQKLFVPAWRRHIGVVFQEPRLFPHLSVQQNLLYGAHRLPAAQRKLTPPAVIELLELRPLLQRAPEALSGGERQRVALGRALLYSPRLLLLDEPLSSLDQRLKQQILPFLRRVRDEVNIPMIYVSHDRDEVDYLAARVLQMESGLLAG